MENWTNHLSNLSRITRQKTPQLKISTWRNKFQFVLILRSVLTETRPRGPSLGHHPRLLLWWSESRETSPTTNNKKMGFIRHRVQNRPEAPQCTTRQIPRWTICLGKYLPRRRLRRHLWPPWERDFSLHWSFCWLWSCTRCSWTTWPRSRMTSKTWKLCYEIFKIAQWTKNRWLCTW